MPEKIQLYFIYNQIKDIKEYQKERTIYVHIRRIKVEKYVRDILQQHDLSVARNSTNKKIFNNIVDKCMDDLKNTELRDQFDNDNQVKYFVRQSILYLIVK